MKKRIVVEDFRLKFKYLVWSLIVLTIIYQNELHNSEDFSESIVDGIGVKCQLLMNKQAGIEKFVVALGHANVTVLTKATILEVSIAFTKAAFNK